MTARKEAGPVTVVARVGGCVDDAGFEAGDTITLPAVTASAWAAQGLVDLPDPGRVAAPETPTGPAQDAPADDTTPAESNPGPEEG